MRSPSQPQARTFRSNPLLAALAIALALPSCGDPRSELPAGIETAEVLASSSTGWFREGCATTVYRLAPTTAAAAAAQGAAFFRRAGPPPTRNPRNPWSQWRQTPLPAPDADSLFALRALGGCEAAKGDFRETDLRRALRTPGSHYSVTANREGLILIAPHTGLAAFLYFG